MKVLISLFILTCCITINAQVLNSAFSFGGNADIMGRAIQVNSNTGEYYVASTFSDTVDFDPGVGTNIVYSNTGSTDFALSKFDNGNNLIWVITFGSFEKDQVYTLALDSSGNPIIAGRFRNTIDFDPGTGTTNLSANIGYNSFIAKYDVNGNLIWAKSIESDDISQLFVDLNGDIYVSGNFLGTVDIDPGPGIKNLSATGGGNNDRDAFFAKYSANFDYIWGYNYTCWSYDNYITELIVDSLFNIYITGIFADTIDLAPAGPSPFTLLTVNSGHKNGFIAKYDSSGSFIWGVEHGGNYKDDETWDIALDDSLNCYVTGRYRGMVDFDPGIGTDTLFSTGGNDDIFFAKYDALGNYKWAKSIGGTGYDVPVEMIIDKDNNINIMGECSGNQSDFDPDTNIVDVGPMDESLFYAKYDRNGNFIYVGIVDGGGNNFYQNDMDIDTANNVYITGAFASTMDFDPGTGIYNMVSTGNSWMIDAFVLRMEKSIVGINENKYKEKDNIITYPNPSSEILNITSYIGKYDLYINTIDGKNIIQLNDITDEKKIISIKNLTPGLYILIFKSEKETFTKKILKQ